MESRWQSQDSNPGQTSGNLPRSLVLRHVSAPPQSGFSPQDPCHPCYVPQLCPVRRVTLVVTREDRKSREKARLIQGDPELGTL